MDAARSFSLRMKVGLIASGLTIVLLLYPGRFEIPLNALAVWLPRGCTNGFAAYLLVFGLAINLVLMVTGVAVVVSAVQRVQAGLVLTTLFDVTIATLFLIPSLTFPWTQADMSSVSYAAVTGLAALVPVTAAILLLDRRAYSNRRAFVVTLIAFAVILAPGIAGAIAFGAELSGLVALPPPAIGCA